jgi:hypothetical protein
MTDVGFEARLRPDGRANLRSPRRQVTRSRTLVAVAATAAVFGGACVDLFHSTDIEMLCDRSPSDPQCRDGAAAKPDASTLPDGGAADARPDVCSWSSTEAREHALRACAWLGACEGPLGESAFGPCVVHAQLAYDCTANPGMRPAHDADTFWSCLATASSCTEVDRCVFPGGVPKCAAVAAGSFTGCSSTEGVAPRVKCASPGGGRAEGVEPCIMLGQSCVKEDDSTARCGGSLANVQCTQSGCSGTFAVGCDDPASALIDVGVDCAASGAGRCEPSDAGPVCAPGNAAKSCGAEKAAACEGTTVTSCLSGREIRVDCGPLGLPCNAAAAPSPFDIARACGNEPDAGACAGSDRCAGTRLEACGRGATYAVDCASVGLGSCAIGPSGHAACAKP